MVWVKAACGVWGRGHVFGEKLYLTRDICKEDQIPKQLKVPVNSKPAKPAPKRADKQAAQSTSASSSNPELPTEHVQEFKVERSFMPRLWKGHLLRSGIAASMGLTLPVLCMGGGGVTF